MPRHTKKEVHFYKQLILPLGLDIQDIMEDLMCLLRGEFRRIKPHTVYKQGAIRIFSMSVGETHLANRLIFTVKDGNVVVLALVLSHNYERCKFLQEGVAKQYLIMHGGDIDAEATIEAVDTVEGLSPDPTLKKEEVKRVDFEWVNRQIYLTDEQDQVLACELPAIVTGVPGSGKSVMLLLAARDFLLKNPGKWVGILAKSGALINTLRAHWQQMGGSPNAQFFSYDAFLNEEMLTPDGTSLTPEGYFAGFYQEYLRCNPWPTQNQENPALVFEEVCHRAACANDETYNALGKKQSRYDRQPDLQNYVCNLYREYLRDLESRNYVDSALFSITTTEARLKRHLALIVDESQDLTRCQHDVLAAYAGPNLLLFNGSHQSIAQTTDPVLLARTQHTPNVYHLPPLSHRCSKAAARVANAVIEIKVHICGNTTNQPLIQTTDNAPEGEVCFAHPEDIKPQLLVRATEPGAVIITTQAFLEEAKARFPDNIVVTVEQFKGLECRTVYLYNLFQDKSYATINQLLQSKAPVLEEHKPFQIALDVIITALSRTTDWICVIEGSQHHSLQAIFDKLTRAAQNTAATPDAATSAELRPQTIEDRRAFIAGLVIGGLVDQARQEWLRYCGSPEGFYTFTAALPVVQTSVEVPLPPKIPAAEPKETKGTQPKQPPKATKKTQAAPVANQATILDFLQQGNEEAVTKILAHCTNPKSLLKLLNTSCGAENQTLDVCLQENPAFLKLFTRCFINTPELFIFDLPTSCASLERLVAIKKELNAIPNKSNIPAGPMLPLTRAILGAAPFNLVRQMLELGASPIANKPGLLCPLATCVSKQEDSLVKILVEYVDKPEELESALFLAIKEKNRLGFLILCKFRDDLNAVQNQRTLPYCAAESGQLNILHALELHDVNLNSPSYHGITPFCIATLKQFSNIIKFFLQKGINPHNPSFIEEQNLISLLSEHKIAGHDINTYIQLHRDPSGSDIIGVSPYTLAQVLGEKSAIAPLFKETTPAPDIEAKRRPLIHSVAVKIAAQLMSDFDQELVSTLMQCSKQPEIYQQLLEEKHNGKTIRAYLSEEPYLDKFKNALALTPCLLGQLDLSSFPKLKEFQQAGITLGAMGKVLPVFYGELNPLLFAMSLMNFQIPCPTQLLPLERTHDLLLKQIETTSGVACLVTGVKALETFMAFPSLIIKYISNWVFSLENSLALNSAEQRKTLLFLTIYQTGYELINGNFTRETLSSLLRLLTLWQKSYPAQAALFDILLDFDFAIHGNCKKLKHMLYQNEEHAKLFAGCFVSNETNLIHLNLTTLVEQASGLGRKTMLQLRKITNLFAQKKLPLSLLAEGKIQDKIELIREVAKYLKLWGTHPSAVLPVAQFIILSMPRVSHDLIKGIEDIIALLIECGDPCINGIYLAQTLLISAIISGPEKIVSALLKCPYIEVNVSSSEGMTALWAAVHGNKIKIIEPLLKAGADPTATGISQDGKNRHGSPLSYAATRSRDVTALKLLLKYVKDVNKLDDDGVAIIHRAAAGETPQVIEILRCAGANLQLKDNQGRTPLFIACQQGKHDIASLLASMEPMCCDTPANDGLTPLYKAAESNDFMMVQTLLRNHANAEIPRITNLQVLKQYCRDDRTAIKDRLDKFLTRRLAQGDSEECIQTKPIDIAYILGHEIIRLLLNQAAIHRVSTAALPREGFFAAENVDKADAKQLNPNFAASQSSNTDHVAAAHALAGSLNLSNSE